MARNYLRSLLGDQEEIQLVSRQHWFVLFRMVILELIAMLVLVVILVIAQASLPNIPVGFGYVLLVLPLISIASDTAGFTWQPEMLPMEYAIEFNRLVKLEMEGSLG